ncbi:hypothetical protein [Gordonia zhaorongruii]|uniref:hypothetical protein n=1 Tax=Gordonia zhaorongruii TaxID=2597659 RepID=UPI001045C557|nr:hypothetical protein [Gordonia zhaorongruii]
MTYPGPPNGPRKSALSSPAVLIAIIAGLVILIGGVGGAMLWADNQSDDTSQAASSSSSAASESPRPPDSTVTVTQAPTDRAAPPQTQSPVPTTSHPAPTVSGADWQGFGEAGARCNADDAAVFIGYTSRSKVVICQVGSDSTRLYYKGFADGQGKEISYPSRSGGMFTATAEDGTVYRVSTSSLTISQGGEQVADEPMVEAWTN